MKRGLHHLAWSVASTFLLGMSTAHAVDDQNFSLVDRGQYLAIAADCAACHTAPGGKPYAGGLPLQTPFGTIVASNITPDRDAGIGALTDDEFVSSLREGRSHGGKRLYPAMPYPAYSQMTRNDALAIRAYLQTIEPVPVKVETNLLPFPFNIRFSLAVWNAINFRPREITADPAKSPEWNRGHYLVDALGHCGICHTPKNIWGADKSQNYLQGANLQDWFAPSLTPDKRKGIGSWSDDDLFTYLKTGATSKTIASGPMAEVIQDSTSRMTDDDVKAIVAYLKDQPQVPSPDISPLATSDNRMVAGAAIFKDRCAACHTDAGTGSAGLFSTLAGDSIVQSDDPTTVIRVILEGTQSAHTDKAPTSPAMPSFGWQFTDEQVASVANYIRNSWGNAATPVSSDQVTKLRNAQ